MSSQICGKWVVVPRNSLKMEYVPQGIYKLSLIQIILRTILNHHKWNDILGECMKLAIHWVEDIAIDVPHLFARKLHSALQDSKMKRVKFSYLGTLQKIIDLCRPSVVGSNSIRTYIRKPKEQQKNEELPQPYLKNNVEVFSTVTTSTIHGQPLEDNMEPGKQHAFTFP